MNQKKARAAEARVRTKEPDRAQGWLFKQMPEQLVEPEHPVRVVAAAVEALDLSGFVAGAKAVEGHAGRPVTSPRLLLALWVYGIQQGVGRATELARRCEEDRAFEWLAGGVKVSHDKLSQFRVESLEVLQQVFSDVLAVLLQQGLVSLEQVAQDGTRVRASASARGRLGLPRWRPQSGGPGHRLACWLLTANPLLRVVCRASGSNAAMSPGLCV